MLVEGKPMRTIWTEDGGNSVLYIDQTLLPYELRIRTARSWERLVQAIERMEVRGAPLIGVSGAWAAALAVADDPSGDELRRRLEAIASARPTAVNLQWAVKRMSARLSGLEGQERIRCARSEAARMAEEDVAANRSIGRNAARLLRALSEARPGRPLQILTHCNAGWLATVDYGTALSGVYQCSADGIPVHVWADETRPRLQGLLTEWELRMAGVPVTLVADNAGGYLMQRDLVDVVIVGADRIAANGDAANKIGTYLKALAARESGVPFYVAAPFSTIDFSLSRGSGIPIEKRPGGELREIRGVCRSGSVSTLRIAPQQTDAFNPGFDVTPAELVTGFITEKGVLLPSELLKWRPQ
ncbi:S-methyl-5-thioribose-1-phosphate isomerase [Mesosutterella porci]|nr:S-methyl-5-thioribose-1-phosphate isomerase [Mesosutterella sp. oilRF-744-WT-GAM-9]